MLIAMDDESVEEIGSDEYEFVEGKNGRVKGKNKGGWERGIDSKKSKRGKKEQAGQAVAVLTIKAKGKKKAAFNAFKVAEWIGQYAGRGPEVKVERTKEANLLVTCSTFGDRKLVLWKWFGEVEVEIVMGVPREENECKGLYMGLRWT